MVAIFTQSCIMHLTINGPLAQLVEQRTFNPLVERSSRSRPTKVSGTIQYHDY